VNFINKCMSSENSVVRTVSYHGVFLRHMFSPIGASAIFCCNEAIVDKACSLGGSRSN